MPSLRLDRDLSPAGRERLSKGMKVHILPKGSMPVAKGQPVSGAYLVLRGQLRVFTLTATGKEATLYLLRPGETCILALNSLFANLLYPAWVQADEDSEVGIIPGPVFRALFDSEPAMRDLTVRALSMAVFRLMDELEQVHSRTIEQRLAGFLLTHAASNGVLARTQQEIAAHIGTTREVVGRQMADFAARGLVTTARGRVTLRRPDSLAALVEDA